LNSKAQEEQQAEHPGPVYGFRNYPGGWTSLQTIAVLAIGLAYSLGILLKLGPLNGIPEMSNWEWPWRSFGVLRTAALLLAPLPLIAWVVWKAEGSISRSQARWFLALLVVANYGLQLLEVLVDRRGYALFIQIVTSPKATSYYTDALAIESLSHWLGTFHLQQLHNHAATHPPAPILFYYLFVKLLGPSAAALWGACVIGFIGSLGILVMYHFVGLWTRDRRTRILAGAFYSVVPALVVFFPEFDQIYPLLAMLLVICWVKALNGSPAYAFYLGITLFVSTFFAYNLLTAGVFLAYYGIYWLWRQRSSRAIAKLVVSAGIALALWAGIYAALWGATGYDPFASLRSALASQAVFAGYLHRSYIRCAIYDPYDFAMGAGFIAVVIIGLYLWRNARPFDGKRADVVLTLIGLATIFTVDFSGLLRAETARVWLFYQPLLVAPVALELAKLGRPSRLAVIAVQWWILVCLKASMAFIRP
jgi:hypothetical protein